MNRLLSIELKKIIPYRTFWILTGIYVLIILLSFVKSGFMQPDSGFEFNFNNAVSQKMVKDFQSTIFSFPHIWPILAYSASYLNMLLSIIVIILVTNEFSFRTLRQHIIDGMSVAEVFASKLGVILLLTVGVGVFLFAVGLIHGFNNTASVTFGGIFEKADYLVVYMVQALGYMSFALLFGVLIKRAGMAFGMFFLYTQVIERIIRWVVDSEYDRYLPAHVFSDLVTLSSNIQSFFSKSDATVFNTNFYVALVYIPCLLAASFLVLKNRDA